MYRGFLNRHHSLFKQEEMSASSLRHKLSRQLSCFGIVLLGFGLFSPSRLWAQEPQKEAAPKSETPPANTPKKPSGRAWQKRLDSSDKAKEDATIQRVQIQAAKQSESELRRHSIAGKIVIGREELEKDGDTSIGEILKRLPGVTLGGRAGRGGEIRMRGMGGSYTQMLVNGERPPRGFSMESLSPDQVERIEIMRGPVAEFSTQAIAGTINVVLREDFQLKDTDLKWSAGVEQGRLASSLSWMHPLQLSEWQSTLSGTVSSQSQRDQSYASKTEIDRYAALVQSQDQVDVSKRSTQSIQLTPRFSRKMDNGAQLNFQPFVMSNRSESRHQTNLQQHPERIDPVTGQAPFALALANGRTSATSAKMNLNYQHKLDQDARLSLRAGLGLGLSNNETHRLQFSAGGARLNEISDISDSRDQSLSLGGKYQSGVIEAHQMAVGWEVEQNRRSQTRTALDNGKPQWQESGENLDAMTRRAAFFVQDEMDLSAQWSAYAGLRWEGIQTQSQASRGQVRNRSGVLSPIVHVVYRIPERGRDQIRMSLTHSYRAPNLNDMIAVPSFSPYNSPTRPDRSGNPALKPELARGIDVAYEHYLSPFGVLSANVFFKHIDQLIRRQTTQVQIGEQMRWLNSPVNLGQARAFGIELEAKLPLQSLFANAPAFDIRSNYSRFWSSVDGIQGPHNRIDQQPKQIANLGIDYRPQGAQFNWGLSLNWSPAYENQTSDTQLNLYGMKRQLDAYLLWKISPQMRLRLSANNALPLVSENGSRVYSNGSLYTQDNRADTYRVIHVRLEMKF